MRKRKTSLHSLPVWAAAVFLMIFAFWYVNGGLRGGKGTELRFIDVGNADCCLLTSDCGGNILVDAGNEGDGDLIKRHMRLRKADKLDAVFISHFHSDHMGGLFDLLGNAMVPIEKIYYPNYAEKNENRKIIENLAKQSGTEMIPLEAGDEIKVGVFTFSVLLPKNIISSDAAFTGEDDENNRSLVLRLTYENTSALFAGDLEKDGESYLRFEDNLESDILKAAHHGSNTSSSDEFLSKVRPKYAVVPTGENSYGHPGADATKRITKSGAQILRSDQCGTLRFILGADGIEDIIAEKKIK